MSMQSTPKSERTHISLFGRRNAGKSSIINALTGQDLAVVSPTKGTTTDPVSKAMELLPLGPVVITDTPGLDDSGSLGSLRVEKALQILNKTDIALLICDIRLPFSEFEQEILQQMREKKIPHMIILNQTDTFDGSPEQKRQELEADTGAPVMAVSAVKHYHIHELKEALASLLPHQEETPLIRDLLSPGDVVVLVVPIDSAAPKGRLILPQQQVLREVLDSHATAVVCQTEELAHTIMMLAQHPRIVITDSQVFAQAAKSAPANIPLTSFSILFARYKGELRTLVDGANTLSLLKDGDTVLIAEGCTHHRQCDDIGTVKIPRWIREYTGKNVEIETVSGNEFPRDLSHYQLVVHCGGCMLNRREMIHRLEKTANQGVPMVNYGVLIAAVTGVLSRSLEPFSAELS